MSTIDYGWLKAECQFKMQVHEKGFNAREIIGVGEGLYDVVLSWLEPDGSVFFYDIGGQKQPGWDPSEGHGALLRLKPDDSIEAIVPYGNMGKHMPLDPKLAPAHFGNFGGHVFFVGQKFPGREGAHLPHLVFNVPPGADRPEIFCEIPFSGKISKGIPGALMTGPFGLPGTAFANKFFIMSFMNCTIYEVTPDRVCKPFIVLDEPLFAGPVMPCFVRIAPPWWGELAGELIVMGKLGASFETEYDQRKVRFEHFHIRADGTLDTNPMQNIPAPIFASKAPPEFGPFGGDYFWVDEGPIDLSHTTKFDAPLVYKAKLMRKSAKDGNVSVFADNFQGSYTSLIFDKNRLVMGLSRKSYSTGEYHEPDSSIYEIRYVG